MPNYTHNTLIVKGDASELMYFYERNKVSKDDSKYLGNIYSSPTELSFSKFINIDLLELMTNNDDANYSDFWGTKWDAFEIEVNLSNIDEGQIEYKFTTAWKYPDNWLIKISQIFVRLEFYITYSNERDGYDMVHMNRFIRGECIKMKSFSSELETIERYGGINKILEDIILYLNEHPDEKYYIPSEKYNSPESFCVKDYLSIAKDIIEKNKSLWKNPYDAFIGGDYIIIESLAHSNESFNLFLEEYFIIEPTHIFFRRDVQKCFIEKIKDSIQ